ncbi:MAG: hypothetical protein AAFV85_18070 [Cyanobacteria bacterium J06634_6]
MKGNWQDIATKTAAKLTVWLLMEIFLNIVGLDTLADYSEYILTTTQAVKRESCICCVTICKQYPAG